MPNAWAINLEPAISGKDTLTTPTPRRHLNNDGKIGPTPAGTKEEGDVSFGFGGAGEAKRTSNVSTCCLRPFRGDLKIEF